MKNPLPNPFLPKEAENDFALDADAFLDAIAPTIVPQENESGSEAPDVVPTYPQEFETFDLEELAGLPSPGRWRITPMSTALASIPSGRHLLARKKLTRLE